ncbi:MAG: SdpI family protein [Mycobacterium sp.]
MSVFYALSFMVLTVVLITVNWRAANGRLQRNQWAGIRIPSTMRSDQAWVAGHRAALRLTPLYLLVLAGLLTALFVAVLCVSTGVAMLVGIGGLFVYVPVALYSAFVANRAAKAADKYPDDRYRQ